MRQICKNGLPSGNVFEFAATSIEKYERKIKGLEARNALENKKRSKYFIFIKLIIDRKVSPKK